MKFDSNAIVVATSGDLIRRGAAGTICTDTRKVTPGVWFLALVGDRFDGHDYVEKAIALGAVGVIVSGACPEHVGCVRVKDTMVALQRLGMYARQHFPKPVVGLTGSSGKTTTRCFIALALSPLGPIHQTSGNLNNHLGVPMTLVDLPLGSAAMVVEMGTSSPGEIQVLSDIATPDIRVIVNVGSAHLEELGGLDGVAAEKGALFRSARPGDTVVVNTMDARVDALGIPDGVRRVRVGPGGDVGIRSVELRPDDLETKVTFETPEGVLSVNLPGLGEHLAVDASLAVGVAWAAGVDLRRAVAALARYEAVGMRMRIESLDSGVRVFNDAYNANPDSLRASLRSFAAIDGRKFAVLGDMLELGPSEQALHRQAVQYADGLGLDGLFFVGERMCAAQTEAQKTPCQGFATPQLAGEALRDLLQSGDNLLLKGSRGAHVEDVLPSLFAKSEVL